MDIKPKIVMPALPAWISEPDKLHVGMPVFHFGNPADVWFIEGIQGQTLFCSTHQKIPTGQGMGDHKDCSKQFFPIGSMACHPSPEYLERTAPALSEAGSAMSAPVKPREKKEKAPDHIGDTTARLLATCKNVEECWVMAKRAGLNIAEVKAKIGHLSNGLQRMGIGNRMRKLPDQDKLAKLLEKANG